MTGCEQLTAGDVSTVGWLVGAVALGIAVGRRTAADIVARNRMRAANWVAVVLAAVGSGGVFAYMLSDVRRHCGSPSAEILFALQPVALSAFLTLGALMVVHRLRVRGSGTRRPDG
jgi:hypothetical protein